MKRRIRILVVFFVGATVLSAAFTIMMWPPFTSEETELTGLCFQLSETAFFDDTGIRGEGHRIWIYRIPEDAAQRLNAKDYPLSEYPMWCALAFDGYNRIRWTPSNGTGSADIQLVLESALHNDSAAQLTLNNVASMDDAREFARDLTKRDGTLVAGWYTVVRGDVITNYFLYVMNLDERVLVKLSLLT